MNFFCAKASPDIVAMFDILVVVQDASAGTGDVYKMFCANFLSFLIIKIL